MHVSLASARRRWLFLAGTMLITGLLTLQAGKHWLAEHWARSSEPQDWARAAELQPGNASYWYRLGQSWQLNLQKTDLSQAILYYHRATETNPRSAVYWMELASGYEMSGEPDRAWEAFEKAKSSSPVSPEVAWRSGNFLLRHGQLSPAFAEIRRSLVVDPRLALLAVDLCWRASGDVERILDEVLPPENSFYLRALHFFLSRVGIDPALTVWNRLLILEQPFKLQRAFPLLEALIREGRLTEAKDVWQQALRATGTEQQGAPAEASLVWNGGFERELVNGGFGWRRRRVAGASFDFDSAISRSGLHSLRVTFDGTTNLDLQHLVQYVLVKPRSFYRFQAYLRTEGISSDSGIRFRIYDPQRPGTLDISSPNLVGTVPWSLQEVQITTGPETGLLAIMLRRIPSRKFDNKLRGSVWVDDVSLAPLESTGAPPSP